MERAAFTAAPIAQALDIPLIAWKEIHEEGGIFSRGDKRSSPVDKANILGLPGKPRSFFMQNFRTLTLPDDLDETGWWNRPLRPRRSASHAPTRYSPSCSPVTATRKDSRSSGSRWSVTAAFSCAWFAPSSNFPGGRQPWE